MNPGSGPHGGGGGGGVGKATFENIFIIHKVDKASPLLMRACATSAHLKEATITHRKPGKGKQDYLIVKLNDVIVTAVTDGVASGQPGSETVGLAFAKIDFEYKPQKADGSLDAGIHFKYGLKTNKEG